MNKQTTKRAVAVAVVGAVMLGSVPPSGAAPISSSMTILKQAAQSSGVTDVRYRYYRGRGYYGNPGAAIGLGILGAAAGAAALGAYGLGYYGPGYYGYGPGYYYAPGYYGAPYPYRRGYYYRY
ncbi:hypothetical protein [Bradyrhizobium sp.]|uniref:hypothetical protein n=1 Tax=Bradyrhizobium sp. TaxID=376 RepID=UPI0025C724C1|nr:hypothetical protein [Bradyrhizobium sp.]